MKRTSLRTPKGERSKLEIKMTDTVPKVPLQRNPRELRRIQKENRRKNPVLKNAHVFETTSQYSKSRSVALVAKEEPAGFLVKSRSAFHRTPTAKNKPGSVFSLFDKADTITFQQPHEVKKATSASNSTAVGSIKDEHVFQVPEPRPPADTLCVAQPELPSGQSTAALWQRGPEQKPSNSMLFLLPSAKSGPTYLRRQHGATPRTLALTKAMETPAPVAMPRKRMRNSVKSHKTTVKPPTDWSLHSVARFTSAHNFEWCRRLKSHIHPRGLSNALRCIHDEDLPDDLLHSTPEDVVSLHDRACAELQKAMIYWEFNPPTTEESDRGDTQTAFEASLCSLYEQMQSKLCPYFYVKAKAFTVLFIGEELGGCAQRTARVSSSTPGLRSLLSEEGITFHMPHWEEEFDKNDNDIDMSDDDADGSDIEVTMDAIENATQSQSGYDGGAYTANPIDGTAKSMLMFRGQDVSLFYNFLVNGEGGSHTIPTALYAPSPFSKAKLETLKITRNRVLALKSSSADAEFRFEIEGPIMPLCLTRIIDLFNVTQRGTFGVSLSPFNNSKGVNVHPMPSESVSTQMVPNPKALLPKFQSEELDELAHSCGVTRRELDTLTKPPSAQLTSVRRIQKESSSSPYVWWAS